MRAGEVVEDAELDAIFPMLPQKVNKTLWPGLRGEGKPATKATNVKYKLAYFDCFSGNRDVYVKLMTNVYALKFPTKHLLFLAHRKQRTTFGHDSTQRKQER